MLNRVVITGIGPVSSIGVGKETFFKNVYDMKTNIKIIPDEFTERYEYRTKYYVPRPEVSLSDFEFPSYLDTATQYDDRFSLIASVLALIDAGYQVGVKNNRVFIEGLQDTSVIIGIGVTDLDVAYDGYFCHVLGKSDISSLERSDEVLYSKLIKKSVFNKIAVPLTMTSSITAWTSIVLNLKGSNFTVNAACSSGTIAVGESFRRIKHGYDKVVLAGGTESFNNEFGTQMRAFDVLGALTLSENGNPMPFSKERSGFLFSQGGSCMLVLEELEHARSRGANIYAEIVDYDTNSDSHNIFKMDRNGMQIVKLLERLIKGKYKIDYINSHGTGTIQNDETEADVIQMVFGDKDNQPYVNSSKALLGHTIGASGAFEIAITAKSMKDKKIHGYRVENAIENLNIVSETIEAPIEHAISTSYGFGGHNAAILLKKYN